MRASAISRRASTLTLATGLVVVALVGIVALTAPQGSSAQAQTVTDFVLSVSSTTLSSTGGSAEVVVSIDPGESAIAAVGARVTVDASTIAISECVALVGLGACGEEAPGVLNLQTVDPAGWASATDLFRITYDVSSLPAEAAITIEPLEAFDVSGVLIAGAITNGTIGIILNGDVDCDSARTIGDALVIAQYIVGLRTEDVCPLPDPRTQIDLTAADVTGDGSLDIGDALQVARCTVGLLDCDA